MLVIEFCGHTRQDDPVTRPARTEMPEDPRLTSPTGPRAFEAPPIPQFCGNSPVRRFYIGPYPWLVFEHTDNHGPALFFFGPGTARRVRRFPPNWQELSDELLYAVSWTP